MQTIRIYSYEEWHRRQVADLKARIDSEEDVDEGTVEVDCHACDGDGEIEDRGVETGRYFTTECPVCDGDGTVSESRIDALESDERLAFSYRDYVKAVEADVCKILAWLGWPPAQGLIEQGFSFHCRLTDRPEDRPETVCRYTQGRIQQTTFTLQ